MRSRTLMKHGRVFRFRTIIEQYRTVRTVACFFWAIVCWRGRTLQFSLRHSLLRTKYLHEQNNALSIDTLSNTRISEKIQRAMWRRQGHIIWEMHQPAMEQNHPQCKDLVATQNPFPSLLWTLALLLLFLLFVSRKSSYSPLKSGVRL